MTDRRTDGQTLVKSRFVATKNARARTHAIKYTHLLAGSTDGGVVVPIVVDVGSGVVVTPPPPPLSTQLPSAARLKAGRQTQTETLEEAEVRRQTSVGKQPVEKES